MQNVLNQHYSHLKLTALAPLREPMPVRQAGQCPFLGWLGRATRDTASWLVQTVSGQRTRSKFEPLDDRTLNDIGLTRVDASDWVPK